jgi:hypothetical protein
MVSTLALRRGGGRVIAYRAMRGSPYGRAYAAARMAQRYGPSVYRTTKVFARWMLSKRTGQKVRRKGRFKFNKARYGHPNGTSSAKMHQGKNDTHVSGATKTLYVYDCFTDILQGSTGNELNRRRNRAINLRGIKICFHVENNLSRPVWLNFAILQRKDQNAMQTPHGDNFFRCTGQSDVRGKDFSTALTGLELKCLPINPDKFLILRHTRWTIGPKNGQDGHNYYKTFDFYKHLNREIRYTDQDGNQTEQSPLEFVWWCSTPDDTEATETVPNAVTYGMRTLTYFRDIQGRCC